MIEKIKNFLKRIFFNKKNKLINAAEITDTDKEDISSFKESIKIENKEEYRILNLQKKFKNGNIKVEKMRDEDKESLILLYINDIKKQLNAIKNKI